MRCIACDAPLSVSESPWLPEHGRFEDMCRRCRGTIVEQTELPTNSELLEAGEDTLADLPWE